MVSIFKKANSFGRQTQPTALRILTAFIFLLFLIPILSIQTAEAATSMKHSAPDYFVSNHRIQLQANVEDPSGIKLVRCYFKAAGEADLVFVPMNMVSKNEYIGILPAPSASTSQIEYLFLAVNTANVVVRSQNFSIYKDGNKEKPAWQEVPQEGEIKVSMELEQAPTELRGFSDNIAIDAVESGARFGVVALLYHHLTDSDSSGKSAAGQTGSGTAAGSAASSSAVASAKAATGATSAGIITAGTAGWSTAAIVGLGVGAGVATVAGGTALAINANDDDGGGGSNNNNDGDDDVIVTQCNAATFPGGDTPETHSVDLGQRSGTFVFEYETYGQEDRMIVTYEGTVLFDTGCLGTFGTRTQTISYSGRSSNITVEVIPNCAGGSGTAWEFTVNCP